MNKIKPYLYFLPSVAMLVLIYKFSAQTGSASGSLSGHVAEALVRIVHPDSTGAVLQARIQALQLPVRKAAHFSEYALLCLTWLFGFMKSGLAKGHSFQLALALSLTAACADEFHQSMVPGRSPQVLDVCIDFAGACVAAGLTRLAVRKTR